MFLLDSVCNMVGQGYSNYFNFKHRQLLLRIIFNSPASFHETRQWLKFPLNGLQAQTRVSPVVGLLPLASGPACLGMAFPPILDKLLEYKRNWIQHVYRIPCNRLPRVMKHKFPTGRRNCGRPLKRLLDTWDWNGSTSGPTPWQIYDDDDDDDNDENVIVSEKLQERYQYV